MVWHTEPIVAKAKERVSKSRATGRGMGFLTAVTHRKWSFIKKQRFHLGYPPLLHIVEL